MEYIIAGIRIAVPQEFTAGSFGMALAPFAAPDTAFPVLTIPLITCAALDDTETASSRPLFSFFIGIPPHCFVNDWSVSAECLRYQVVLHGYHSKDLA